MSKVIFILQVKDRLVVSVVGICLVPEADSQKVLIIAFIHFLSCMRAYALINSQCSHFH